MLNDPEYAAALVAQPESDEPWRPSVADWTPELAALTDIKDRLAEVVVAVIASAGGKTKAPPPSPRPVTEVERARRRAERAQYDALVDEVKQAQQRWAATHGG